MTRDEKAQAVGSMLQTPEQAHSALVDAIEYELVHYGPASLAEVCSVLIENRVDENHPRPDDELWQAASQRFNDIAFGIPGKLHG